MHRSREIASLRRHLEGGRIDRRAFIRRAVLLGLSASAIAQALVACRQGAETPTAPPAATRPPARPSATPAGGAGAAPTPPPIATPAPPATPTVAPPPATPAPVGLGTVSPGPFGRAGGLGPGPGARGGGGTLKILYWQAPTILNPHLAQGTMDQDLCRLVYEPLADFDANDQLVPWLAATIPSRANGGVAADGLSVTWRLKAGVAWGDGQPLTARDVAFTWKYATDGATAAVSGDSFAAVKRVQALDDTTVRITFRAPTPAWYIPFTGPKGMIIPEHIFRDGIGVGAKQFGANLRPVGSGPYRVSDFVAGTSAALEVNPRWRDPSGPHFARVEWQGGGDATAAARAVLQDGQYHLAWNLQVEAAVLNQLASRGAKGKLGLQPGFGVERLHFNFADPGREVDGERSSPGTQHPFFTDRAVRRAFALLADRAAIAATLYGPAGEPTAALVNAPASLIPRDLPWAFDTERANRELDAAGWVRVGAYREKAGVPLRVLFVTSSNTLREKEQAIIRDAFERAGIQTTLKTVDADIFFSSDTASPDTATKFYADLEMFTDNPQTPDLGVYLANYTTEQIPSKDNQWGLNNVPRYQNSAYDRLVQQILEELDPARQRELLVQAQQLLHEDAMYVGLIARRAPFGYASGLEGFAPTPWAALTWNIANWVKGRAWN